MSWAKNFWGYKTGKMKRGEKNMLQIYLENKWEWVDRNPRTAAWVGWFKGFFTAFLIWYIFLK